MTSARPNVLVVFADDMGWGDLGSYGATKIQTPAMDRLAAEGVRLTDCHSSSAVCSPSRYSLLTGRYAWRSPLKHDVLRGYAPPIIESTRPTLASVLQDAGYTTGGFGKWNLGLGWRRYDGARLDDAFASDTLIDGGPYATPEVDHAQPFDGGPTELGFDRFFGMAGSLDMAPFCFLDQDRVAIVPDRDKEILYGNQRPGPQSPDWDDEQVDVRIVDEAVSWVRAQAASDRPFFCYVAASAPHRPCLPPEFMKGRSQAGPRGDMVAMVDWMVEQLLEVLDQTDVAENTLVIVTSDNGAVLGDPDGQTYGHHSNGDWRGQKADIWDGGHREPFVARWPGRIPAGAVRDDLVCLTDMMATIAAATGVVLPESAAEDSIDQLPVFTGHATSGPRPSAVHHSKDGTFSYRRDLWKLILGSGSGGATAPRGQHCDAANAAGQLYHLGDDPGEQHNLFDDHPALIVDLYKELQAVCGDSSSGLSFAIPTGTSDA